MSKYTEEEINSLISQLEGLSGTRPMFYMKFCSEKKFAEDVIAGKLYANTPEYFRQKELKSGIRGQGDKDELTLTFAAENLTAYDRDTGDLAFTMSAPTVRIKFDEDEKIPLVSFVGIPLHDMKFIDADEKHAEFDFPFTEDEFETMEETFGKYCVLINARELERKIKNLCKDLSAEYLFEPMIYTPSNSLEKMKVYQTGEKERFLYKDDDLSYQREYRLAIAIEIPEDHYINIGKLSNATILDSSVLKSLRFSVGYQSHIKEN